MADLKETADQFAKDLIAQNIAGLMMAFTPAGMGKAMAMQSQAQASGQSPPACTGFELKELGQEGDDHLVDIVMKNPTAKAIISTKWKDVAGAWKVDDIGYQGLVEPAETLKGRVPTVPASSLRTTFRFTPGQATIDPTWPSHTDRFRSPSRQAPPFIERLSCSWGGTFLLIYLSYKRIQRNKKLNVKERDRRYPTRPPEKRRGESPALPARMEGLMIKTCQFISKPRRRRPARVHLRC